MSANRLGIREPSPQPYARANNSVRIAIEMLATIIWLNPYVAHSMHGNIELNDLAKKLMVLRYVFFTTSQKQRMLLNFTSVKWLNRHCVLHHMCITSYVYHIILCITSHLSQVFNTQSVKAVTKQKNKCG